MGILDAPFRSVNANDIGYDVILLAGQSNEVGYGSGIDTTYLDVTDPRIWQYAGSGSYKGQIVLAQDGLFHYGQNATGVGHAMTFARRYVRTLPPNRRVLLVPAALGSSGFTTTSVTPPPAGFQYISGNGNWDSTKPDGGTSLYQFAIDQANAAIATEPNNRIVAIIWCQGEADSSALSQTQYAAKLDALIAGFRANITGAANVPFLVVSMLPEWIAKAAPGVSQQNVHAAHIDTPRRNQYCSFTYAQSGYANTDVLHHNAAGQRLIGKALFDTGFALAKANVTGKAPLVPGAVTLSQSGTSALVSWVRPICRVTDYKVEYNTGSGWTVLGRTQSLDNAATVTGLTLGSSVQVRVSTLNEQGTSTPSTSASFTLVTLPGQVTGVTAGIATSAVQPLSWTAVAGASSYLVEYKKHTDSTWTSAGSTTNLNLSVAGLATQTSYDYRVTASNAAGSGTASAITTASTTAAAPLMTDVGVTAWRAYGLRKLSSTATRAISVRRSSDNTVQDIGFVSGTNDLDQTALTTFVGSGNGYIATWYDQSGSGYDLTATTTARQARVVTSGTVEKVNGQPAAVFDGTMGYTDTHLGLYTAGAASILAVGNTSSTSGYLALAGEASASGSARYLLAAIANGTIADFTFDDANSGFVQTTGGSMSGAPRQTSWVDTGSTGTFYVSGAVSATNTGYTRSGHTLTLNNFGLGYQATTAGGSFWTGSVSEVVLWTSALTTTQRQAGETNQKNYFGTP